MKQKTKTPAFLSEKEIEYIENQKGIKSTERGILKKRVNAKLNRLKYEEELERIKSVILKTLNFTPHEFIISLNKELTMFLYPEEVSSSIEKIKKEQGENDLIFKIAFKIYNLFREECKTNSKEIKILLRNLNAGEMSKIRGEMMGNINFTGEFNNQIYKQILKKKKNKIKYLKRTGKFEKIIKEKTIFVKLIKKINNDKKVFSSKMGVDVLNKVKEVKGENLFEIKRRLKKRKNNDRYLNEMLERGILLEKNAQKKFLNVFYRKLKNFPRLVQNSKEEISLITPFLCEKESFYKENISKSYIKQKFVFNDIYNMGEKNIQKIISEHFN